GRRQVSAVHHEEHAAQRVGGGAIAYAVQGEQEPARVLSGRLHGELAGFGRTGHPPTQRRSLGETRVGIVGADIDDEFAAHSVRLGDSAYDEVPRLACPDYSSVP